MITHLSIEEIELLALKAVNGDENASGHFDGCKICSAKFREALEFYKRIKTNSVVATRAEVENFVSGLSIVDGIRLHPYRSLPNYTQLQENNITLLAAESLKSPDEKVANELTFASREDGVLLKIHNDYISKSTKFYLLTEEKEQFKNSLIILFDNDGTVGHQLIDENGYSFTDQFEGLDWEKINLLLLKCKMVAEVNENFLREKAPIKINEKGDFFRYQVDERLLQFNLKNMKNISRLLIVYSDNTNGLFFIPNKKDAIKLPAGKEILRILVY